MQKTQRNLKERNVNEFPEAVIPFKSLKALMMVATLASSSLLEAAHYTMLTDFCPKAKVYFNKPD
jgi:hypothetical protein